LGFWSFLVIFGFPTSSSTKRPRVCSHFIHNSIVLISDGPGSDPNRRVFVVVENSVTGTHLPRPLSLSPRGRGGGFRTPPRPPPVLSRRGREAGREGCRGIDPPSLEFGHLSIQASPLLCSLLPTPLLSAVGVAAAAAGGVPVGELLPRRGPPRRRRPAGRLGPSLGRRRRPHPSPAVC